MMIRDERIENLLLMLDIQNENEQNVPHHQTLFFTDRDLEDSLQARRSLFRRSRPFLSSALVVYLENHDNPVKEIDAEII